MKNICFVIAITCLFSACGSKKTETQKEEKTADNVLVSITPAQAKNMTLSFGNLEQKAVSSILKLNGKIDVPPQNMVSISVPLGGYLKATKLLPGMHINKGEVIAVIEDPQYIQLQQDFLLIKSKIVYSQIEFDRQRELNQSQASSDKVFQIAAAELRSLEIQAAGLSEKLKLIGINPVNVSTDNLTRRINIFAPIKGFVTKVNANIGRYISPTDVLFELVNPEDIHLALKVFEKDVDKLVIGQKLVAFTNSNPEKKYQCEILLIGKDLNNDRNTEVHCHFEEYHKSLIPGTYMNAEVPMKSNNAFVLPEEAVVRFEGKQFAFTKKSDSEFEMTEVQTGVVENGYVEILNGTPLSKMTFVTKGAYTLLMRLKNKSEQ